MFWLPGSATLSFWTSPSRALAGRLRNSWSSEPSKIWTFTRSHQHCTHNLVSVNSWLLPKTQFCHLSSSNLTAQPHQIQFQFQKTHEMEIMFLGTYYAYSYYWNGRPFIIKISMCWLYLIMWLACRCVPTRTHMYTPPHWSNYRVFTSVHEMSETYVPLGVDQQGPVSWLFNLFSVFFGRFCATYSIAPASPQVSQAQQSLSVDPRGKSLSGHCKMCAHHLSWNNVHAALILHSHSDWLT